MGKGNVFVKHLARHNDIIKFDNDELQIDGIEIGDSKMDDLTAELVEDKSHEKREGRILS